MNNINKRKEKLKQINKVFTYMAITGIITLIIGIIAIIYFKLEG